MPESFLFHTASSLFGKLASHAYEEASRVYGVYKDLKRFKDTLSIVKGLLLDADEKKNQPQQHALREWLRQIQNICFEAEDVLEGFELRDKRKQVVEASGSKGMKVHDYLFSSNPLAFRIKMAYKLKKIRRKLDKVANVRTEFGLVIVDPGVVTQAREMTYPDVDASSVIGRESDKEEIMKLLMQPHLGGDGDKTFCVIPIVGIGGMGKTTLAKLVYNDNRVANHFQLKMWVSSNDFDIKQIIIKAINSETSSIFASTSVPTRSRAHQENINHLDIVQLVSRLRQKLNGKKFLLVLDDIWSDDRAKWIDLKDLLKVGAPESKIVVTTRSNSIASMMGTVPSYVLKGLLPEDCLSIFIKWSFEKGEDQTHPKLVGIGKVIVEKCQGVPLAVKTIGRSLYSDFDINRWVFVRDSEMWNLDQKKDDILPALKLSYDQMPLYLRQCFACFSLFPKDHIFDSNVMCSLWVSLGLVQSLNGSEKLENVARKYIDQLHSRSLLQDVIPFGSFCQFKVHDLIHDLALYVGQEDFVAVGSHIQNIPQQVRHLSVVESDSVDYDLFPKSKRVRSILFPIGGVGLESESVLDTWVSRYKYLRYLDLSGSSINFVPSSIGKLKHLRFLDLSSNMEIKRLPNSICKLLNLQSLSFAVCDEIKMLPKGLGKLISLQDLSITTNQSILPHDEFKKLIHLHTLSFVLCDYIKILFNEKLHFIEELYLESCASLESLPLSLFPKLKTLSIRRCRNINLLLNNEGPMERLVMKSLNLDGFPTLLELPWWIVCAMDTLEALGINNFPNLKMLPEYLTTMTCLERISIINCHQLASLPNDMHCLTSLQDFCIVGCPKLCRKCLPQSGEYWPMISQIKGIYIEKPKGVK